MTDLSLFEVDLDTPRPNPFDNTQVLRGDSPRTAFTKHNDMLAALNGSIYHTGPIAPTPTVPHMRWLDTGTEPPTEYRRNEANTAWLIDASGLNMVLKGELSDVSELPDDADVGDVYVIDGDAWAWTGESWVDAGDIVGPQGPPGPQGEQGPPGEMAGANNLSEVVNPAAARDNLGITPLLAQKFDKVGGDITGKTTITSATAFPLDIQAGSGSSARIATTGNFDAGFVFRRNSVDVSTLWGTATGLMLDASSLMSFGIAGTSKMSVNATGIRINTTGTQQGVLQVNGNVVLGSGAGERGNKLWLYQISTSNGAYIQAETGGGVAVYAGTTTIQKYMEVNPLGDVGFFGTPTNYTGSGYRTLALNNTTGAILEFQAGGVQQGRITGWSNTIGFHTNNVERVRINDTGVVLQGTTPLGVGINPAFSANNSGAHVHNPTASQGTQFRLTNAGTGGTATDGLTLQIDTSGNSYVYNYEVGALIFGTANDEAGRFNSARNFLLGKSVGLGYKLDVTGQIGVEDGTIRAGWGAGMFTAGTMGFGTTSNHTLSIGTNAITRMAITNSGQVLVGRTTPSSGGMFEVGGALVLNPATAAPTLGVNGDMSFQRVSDTQLKVLMRGSDGTTRSVTLTLA